MRVSLRAGTICVAVMVVAVLAALAPRTACAALDSVK
jgi:hypothetical protein